MVRYRRVVSALAAASFLLSACGGDSSGDETGDGGPVSTSEATSATDSGEPTETTGAPAATTSPPAPADGDTDILGNPVGHGFVTFDGVRHDVVLGSVCQKLFGGLQVTGSSDDGGFSVHAIIPPEDWESDTAAGWDPPFVEIEIDESDWRAQAGSTHFVNGERVALTPEQSAVILFTNDGETVAGEANFYHEFNFEELETATGTFEFTCP